MMEEIVASERRFAEGKLGLWSLRLHGAPAVIGFAGFLPVRGVSQLMYGLLPEYWRKGLATEAARAVIAAAQTAGWREIVAAPALPTEPSTPALLSPRFIHHGHSLRPGA